MSNNNKTKPLIESFEIKLEKTPKDTTPPPPPPPAIPMNNNKQSSIEFLFRELWDMPKDRFDWGAVFIKAEAMHKEEIMDAFQLGKWDWSEHLEKDTESKDPMKYYNETFK